MVVKKKNNKDVEVQDGYIGHVLPFELVQSVLLYDELTALRNDEDRLSQITSGYEEQLDKISEDDKGKDYVNEDKTAFVWAEVKKAIKQKSEEPEVLAVLKEALSLNEEEKKLKKRIKDGSATLHQKTKETIDFVSVYRDTALNKDAGGFNFQKANKAYADYGPEEACRVLERNLDIDIKGYAASNFKGVADVIDALGGVEIEGLTVKTTEQNAEDGKGDDVADVVNKYIDEMNRVYGLTGTEEEEPHVVKGEDKQLLSGLQAVGYSRVRYTEGSDMQRTMRQKAVLIQMIKKYRDLSDDKKITIITGNKKAIETDFGSTDLKDLAELIEAVSKYTIDENLENSHGFPYYKDLDEIQTEEENEGRAEVVVPCDLQTNVKQLHKRIYGVNSYIPGNTVVSYGDALKSVKFSKRTGYEYENRNPDLDNKY